MNWPNSIERHLRLIFNISVVLSIILLIIFSFFTNKEGKFDLRFHFRAASQCDFANIYYTPDQRQVIRIPLIKNNKFNMYETSIPVSTRFFRLDPCNVQENTEIKSIDVYYKNKKVEITKNSINKWLCYNCKFENTKESLLIKPFNGYPNIVTHEFNAEIQEFNLKIINLIKELIYYLLIIAIILPISIFLISKTDKMLIGGLLLYVFITAAIVSNFNAIKSLFPATKIGTQKMVGYIHYIGYPFLLDAILYLFIVILPLFIFMAIVMLKNHINTLKKRND